MNFEQVLKCMKNKYFELSGATVSELSDLGIRFRVLAWQIVNILLKIDELKKQAFVQTATKDCLDKHGEIWGIERKSNRAKGTLRFFRGNEVSGEIIIPIGIYVCTQECEWLKFNTIEEIKLCSNDLFKDVEAEAEFCGDEYNVGNGRINLLCTPIDGIAKITNITSFNGGSAGETDDVFRNRIMKNLKHKKGDMGIDCYCDELLKNDNILNVKLLPHIRGYGSLDLIIKTDLNEEQEQKFAKKLESDLESNNWLGFKLKVIPAKKFKTKIDVNIKTTNLHASEFVKKIIQKKIDNLNIGENLILLELEHSIHKINGVQNYKIISPQSDVLVDKDAILQADIKINMEEF